MSIPTGIRWIQHSFNEINCICHAKHYIDIQQQKLLHGINIRNNDQIDQLRNLLIVSLKNKIILDLHPNNLLVQENGTVTLIDFVEDESDGLFVFVRHALYQWTEKFAKESGYNEEKAREFLSSLTAGFDIYGYNMADNEEYILGKIFFKINVNT
jgi:hypothetical protein